MEEFNKTIIKKYRIKRPDGKDLQPAAIAYLRVELLERMVQLASTEVPEGNLVVLFGGVKYRGTWQVIED